jgi:hypothetical protein
MGLHMKKIVSFLCLGVFALSTYAQDSNLRYYLLLGAEQAEDLTASYLEPVSEGLLFALTGGWYNDARAKKTWELDVSLITNGSFVPKDKLEQEIDISRFENLSVVGGGNRIKIPTILGSSNSRVRLAALLDGQSFEFDAPTGLGLISTNLLPSAFLQAGVGLPANSEFVFRYFPKLHIDDASIGILGLGLKHELSESIGFMNKWPVAVSGMVAYTRLGAEYEFETSGVFSGDDQLIDVALDTWMFELIGSTKFPTYNVYGGVGYVTGESVYAVKGEYDIVTPLRTVEFNDPFDVEDSIDGIRANIGAKADWGRFHLNLDYTFQGYNNLSLGLGYTVLKGK